MMADLTAQLLWYRIHESSEHLSLLWDGISFIVDAGGTVLNYIFLSWLLFGIVTIVIVSALQYHEASKHPRAESILYSQVDSVCKVCKAQCNKQSISASTSVSSIDADIFPQPQLWHNQVLEWLSNGNAHWKAPIMENLLTTLTDESRRLGGDLFVTFEAFLPVGDSPLLNISKVEPDMTEKLVLHGDIQVSGLQISLTVSDNSVSIHSNLLLIVHLLKLQVKIEVENKGDVLSLVVNSGEITSSDLQFFPYHQGVDCITDERKLTHHVMSLFTQVSLPISVALRTEDTHAPALHKALSPADSMGSGRPPKPPRSMEDKRLMIKLIKATKLDRRNIATMDAYCVLEVDNPTQMHSTSVVRNTFNPYWDEHFLFDLAACTRLITFRVYNSLKENEGSKNCLGECQLGLERLRANHGVRMVLPLESRPDMADPVSGSLTIEAFFVNSAELEGSSTPEVDDVFAQSVEPLVSYTDLESPSSGRLSANGDSRLSSISLTGSTSKVIKTSSYVQKDRLSCGSHNSGSVRGVEKAETFQNVITDSGNTSQHFQEVITVYPNQSVTDVVMKELKERAHRSNVPTGRTTSTIIITAAPRMPQVEQPLISLASLESLSDDSSGGTPSGNWEASQHQYPQKSPNQMHLPEPTLELIVPRPIEATPPVERKSRLSGLKKRFTRTKDKKPRSHSIERSSGIDEHRYLDPGYNSHLDVDTSKSDATLTPSNKKKFGGSLRKFLRVRSRSSSRSRHKHPSGDNAENMSGSYSSHERRLSIEGSRPNPESRSSLERSMTPPHYRTLSPSSSYDHRSLSAVPDLPRKPEIVQLGASIDVDRSLSPSYDASRHYSMPSVHRQ
ncbi:C2 domain-containing protein 2-like isoform X2 [Watersipora subatra]|uniref:C2 domain-containing protein 2-like isoform X2 n=1 Tax=Watersipora subatra TaxID=2589382 RepID=UPI00355C1221